LRVDSVHQGDLLLDTRSTANSGTSTKGVYHINFVDEVTQYEFVACVETISERHLLPVLQAILDSFPFVIHEFHADNGSEYINRLVAKLLKELHITLSKSRPRRHNDNALVETKNGSIIRKAIGYGHIPKRHAAAIDAWYQAWFNPYLNYHRPCAFATITTNPKGKQKLQYKSGDYQVPYDKLKSLPDASGYLRPGVTFGQLDKLAYAVSDTEYAVLMNQAQERLKEVIHEHRQPVAETEQTFS
jgi:hypothetical protein